ncbi:hypothetical protein KJ705_03055 [Patescibacteria group bacterium]|nr:hypothetical protein [Patescibacteria group bacterium]
MKAKYIFTIIVGGLIMGVVGVIFFGPTTDDIVCTIYTLDDSTKITDTALKPMGTWSDMRSPNNDSYVVKKIVIDPDDPDMQDEPWRFAMHSEEENLFWIADMPGFSLAWYGPFEGTPCLE